MVESTEHRIFESLNKIGEKLDKHDDSFSAINKTLTKLIEVDVEIRELKSSTRRVFERVEKIEENQNTVGCSTLRSFVALREEQLKKYDGIIAQSRDRMCKVEEKLAKIENVPNKLMFGGAIALVSLVVTWLADVFKVH